VSVKSGEDQDGYEDVKKALLVIRKELCRINESAASSLDEGFEETLTVQSLGLSKELRRSLKTTNCIESVLSQVAQKTDKVDYWKSSNQRQRWTAAALLEIEPRLNRISGHRQLKTLRTGLQKKIAEDNRIESVKKEKEMATCLNTSTRAATQWKEFQLKMGLTRSTANFPLQVQIDKCQII
jgi:transposase-like protein